MSISLLVYYLNLSLRIQEILLAGMYVGGWAMIALYYPRFNLKNRLDFHLIIPVGVVFWYFLIFLLMTKGVGLFGVLYMLIFIISMDARLIPFYNHLFGKGGKGQK